MLQGLWARRRPIAGDKKHSRKFRSILEKLECRRLLAQVTFDFDFDGLGAATTPGQIIDTEYANLGLTITTNDPVNHPAMIFDSSNPTGGDDDLGTPNNTFGGPGFGPGGEDGTPGENQIPHGRILIISEDNNAANPDDNKYGGALKFTFDADVEIVDVDILDIEEANTVIKCYDAANVLLSTTPVATLGDNSYQKVLVNQAGVRRMEVVGPGSLGVPNITISVPNGEEPHPQGRMTGGGSIFLPAGAIGGPAGTRVTHGFELHCAEPSELINNRLQVNWNDGVSSDRFHLLTLIDVECEDTNLIQAPPDAPIDTMHGLLGEGRFSGKHNGLTYDKVPSTIVFKFTDAGEPGVNDEATYLVTVLDGNKDGNANDPVVVLDTISAHKLTKGNHQAHDELKNLTTLALQKRGEINATLDTLEGSRMTAAKLSSTVDTLLSQFLQFETVNSDTYVPPPTKGGGRPTSSRTSLADSLEPEADPLASL